MASHSRGKKKGSVDPTAQKLDSMRKSPSQFQQRDYSSFVDVSNAEVQCGPGTLEFLTLKLVFFGREKDLSASVSMLEKEGYLVDVGELRKYMMENSQDVGLLIIQAQIPEVDVIELMKELRADFLMDFIPIIILTMNSNMGLIDKYIQTGAIDIMQIPMSWELLSIKVRMYMQLVRTEMKMFTEDFLETERALLEKVIDSVQRACKDAQGLEPRALLAEELKRVFCVEPQMYDLLNLRRMVFCLANREETIQQELKQKTTLLNQKERDLKALNIKLTAFKKEHEAINPEDIPGSVSALTSGFKEPLDVLMRQIFLGLQRAGILASDIKSSASKIVLELEASEPRKFRARTSTIMADGLDEQTKDWISANFSSTEETAPPPPSGPRKSVIAPENIQRRTSRFISIITEDKEDESDAKPPTNSPSPQKAKQLTIPRSNSMTRSNSIVKSASFSKEEEDTFESGDEVGQTSDSIKKSPSMQGSKLTVQTQKATSKRRTSTMSVRDDLGGVSPRMRSKGITITNNLKAGGGGEGRRRSQAPVSGSEEAHRSLTVFPQPNLSNNLADLWTTSVDPEMSEAIMAWDFSPYELEEIQLVVLSVSIFQHLGLTEVYDINDAQLAIFFNDVRVNYHANPYHNFFHAFDVMQTCFAIVMGTPLRELLSPVEKYALMIGALCHDLDHPGVNNNFLINSKADLSLVYNDASILENHHASLAFRLLRLRSSPLLSFLSKEEYTDFRKIVIQAILNTDMAVHFSLTDKFSNISKTTNIDNLQADQIRLLLNTILHLADISNPAKTWDISKMWSDRVLTEFLNQGDREKSSQFPVSPFMDRDNVDQVKMSIGFIDFVVRPLFTYLHDLLHGVLEHAMGHLEENRRQWVSMSDPSKAGAPPAPSHPAAAATKGDSHAQKKGHKDGKDGDAGGAKKAGAKQSKKKKTVEAPHYTRREIALVTKAIDAMRTPSGKGRPEDGAGGNGNANANGNSNGEDSSKKTGVGQETNKEGRRMSNSAPPALTSEDLSRMAAEMTGKKDEEGNAEKGEDHEQTEQQPQEEASKSPAPKRVHSTTPTLDPIAERNETRRNLLIIATKQRSKKLVEEADAIRHSPEPSSSSLLQHHHQSVEYASDSDESEPELSTSDELSLVGRKTPLSLPPINTYQPSHHRGPNQSLRMGKKGSERLDNSDG